MEFILQNQPEFLQLFCKNKFVTLVEREWKRLGISEGNQENKRTYPYLCLKLLIDHTNIIVPNIVHSAVVALTETSSRKNPTTTQLKLLKEKIPELSVLPHLLSSSVFRTNLLTEEFVEGISNLGK